MNEAYEFVYVTAKIIPTQVMRIPKGIRFEWGAKNIGFGQLDLLFGEGEQLEIHSEAMGKDFVRQLLNHWVESGKLVN